VQLLAKQNTLLLISHHPHPNSSPELNSFLYLCPMFPKSTQASSNRGVFKKLFVLYILVLLTLLTVKISNNQNLPRIFLGIPMDKWVHMLLFSPLVLGWYLAQFTKRPLSLPYFVFFVALPFAALCESLHYFIPYRTFSIYDFFANSVGIAIGTLLTFLFLRNK
jgi:VanZ family protein